MDDLSRCYKKVHGTKAELERLGDLIKWSQMKCRAKESRSFEIAIGRQNITTQGKIFQR